MRFQKLLAVALVATAILPMSGAQADYPDECDSQIRLLSGRAILFDYGAVNCTYANEPALGSTSYISPGGGSVIVRFQGAQPVNGNKQAGTGSYLLSGTTKTYLKFSPATGADGSPLEGYWDSDDVAVGATASINGGNFTAHVVEDLGPDTNPLIHERTYRSLA